KRFVEAGGKIYAGTDSSAATTPGLSLHHEMELLVDAGLSPMQAIQAATTNGAAIIGLDSQLGTVEKGKIADLVLLDGNPLESIANTKKIFRVIKGGRVIDTKYHTDYEILIKRPGRNPSISTIQCRNYETCCLQLLSRENPSACGFLGKVS